MKKQIKSEFLLFLILTCFMGSISIINHAFLMPANLIDILRSVVVTGIMAGGVTLVIISGGIDISFPAVASFSMYATTKMLNYINYQGPVILPFFIAAAIGLFLGSINAFIIHHFNISTLIATLGTSSVFSGVLLTLIGSAEIYNIPDSMKRFAQIGIFSVSGKNGAVSAFPASIFILIGLVAITWYILRHTMLGRGIFAMGGDINSAERAGFPIFRTRLFIYGFSGMSAGIAGLIHVSMMRMCNPFDILGTELSVIASVVLGGVSIAGGRGSIWGTMIGVFLVTVINKSLIIIGVSSYWQQFVIGIMILVGTGVVSLKEKHINESPCRRGQGV